MSCSLFKRQSFVEQLCRRMNEWPMLRSCRPLLNGRLWVIGQPAGVMSGAGILKPASITIVMLVGPAGGTRLSMLTFKTYLKGRSSTPVISPPFLVIGVLFD